MSSLIGEINRIKHYDGSYVIIGSNAGFDTHPAWFHNLGSNPQASIQVKDKQYEVNAEIAGTGGAPGKVVGLGLRGEEILVWFRRRDYTVQASVAAEEQARTAGAARAVTYEPPLVESQVLTVEEMADGDYIVRWFDPHEARWLEETVATARNSRLTIDVPPFPRDLAAKIVRASE